MLTITMSIYLLCSLLQCLYIYYAHYYNVYIFIMLTIIMSIYLLCLLLQCLYIIVIEGLVHIKESTESYLFCLFQNDQTFSIHQ